MKIVQRSLWRATEFEFQPERLHCTIRDYTGSRQFTVDYADISFDISRVEERAPKYLVIGILIFFGDSLLDEFYPNLPIGDRPLFYTLKLLSVVFLVAYFMVKIKSVLLTAGNEVLIVHDDRHSAAILDEIGKRRKAAFLGMFRRPEFVADEEKRHLLATWLVEKQVIEQHEADMLVTGLEAGHVEPAKPLH